MFRFKFFIIVAVIVLAAVNMFLSHKEQKSMLPIPEDKTITQNVIAQKVDPQKGVLGGCDDGSRPLENGKSVATQKAPDGMYESTGFGCYTGEDHVDTPGCEAACDNPPGECDGLSKHDCMYKLKWFAANADQYGCGNKVKVTNPVNGKAVVLVIYDVGPACSAQSNEKVFDMSYPATSYLGVGNYEKVKVEEVSKDTPLGEVNGASTTGTGTSSGGLSINVAPLSLLVRPKKDVKDTYIINKATAVASGVGTGGAATGVPGSPLPSQDTAVIKKTLCDQYHVCPTQSPGPYGPDQDWTLDQLTALWNVIQRIYQSPSYKAYAIGNYTLEVTRANCYPGGCDGTWGYYAGLTQPAYGNIDNARLVIFTDLVPKQISAEQPLSIIEWVIAHEIGHSASVGQPDGSLADCLNCNDPSRAIVACGTPVSDYANKNDEEYEAEAVAYYMTSAEESHKGYAGPAKNEKQDYPCIYNAAKDGFFKGVEY